MHVAPERWSLADRAESASAARVHVKRYAAALPIDEPQTAAVLLAVSEAVSNAVLHAFARPGPRAPEIVLELSCADGRLRATVSDNGTGMRARSDSPGAGFGVLLICGLADDAEISSPETGGAVVRMAFRLTRSGALGAPPP